MRLPQRAVSMSLRLSFARYLMRRLRRAKLATEEAEVKGLSDAMRQLDLAETTLEEELSTQYADRNAFDDELDDVTKRHRQAIEGRGTHANRERPYIDIYPDGVAWYTASPQAEQAARYELLVRRYGEFLPEGDPVRAEAPLITQALAGWREARAVLDKAELDLAMARAKTQQAIGAWEEGLTRLYFRLAERLGKAQAERFFPRGGRVRRADEPEPTDPGAPTT